MKIKSIRDMKISVKLGLLGVVSIVGLLLLGSESISTAWRLDQMGAQMNDVWLNAVITAEELNTDTSDYRLLETRHLSMTDQEQMDQLEAEMQVLEKDINEKFRTYQMLPTNETEQQYIREAEAVWKEYMDYSRDLIATSRESRLSELMMGQSYQLFDKASSLFLSAVEATKAAAAQQRMTASRLYQHLSHMKLLLIVAVSLLVICLITSLIKGIKEPAEKLAEAARRATNGNLDVPLDYQSEDEIGILTEAMQELIQRVRDIINDETRLFREIGSDNLDARSECEQAYRGDFAPILYAFTSLQSQLKSEKAHHGEEISKLRAEITDLKKRIDEYEQKQTQ